MAGAARRIPDAGRAPDCGADRVVWFEGYARTYLERDLQALSSIAALPDFRRLHAGGLSPARYTGTALEG